ncbi:MAG: acyl-CoA thioester hydrolase [Moritella dasanensis]|jgi:acyl-CoA thioester hydrolase
MQNEIVKSEMALSEFKARVYFEDTDAGGVVYHSNYLNYAERARTEMLRDKGFSQALLIQQDLAFVVRKIDIDYRYPAFLDDLLIIKSSIKELKRASMVFSQSIYHENGKLLSELTVKVACIQLSHKKPCAMPTEIIRKLTSGSC